MGGFTKGVTETSGGVCGTTTAGADLGGETAGGADGFRWNQITLTVTSRTAKQANKMIRRLIMDFPDYDRLDRIEVRRKREYSH